MIESQNSYYPPLRTDIIMVTGVGRKARKYEIDKEPRDNVNVKEAWKMN